MSVVLERPALTLFPAAISILVGACDPAAEQAMPISDVGRNTHIHGIAVDPDRASSVLLATHDGILRASSDGLAKRVSTEDFDIMGFASHPVNPHVLFASGHPKGGGNLGFISSEDAGRTWQSHAVGSAAQDDYHHITVSRPDPRTIYVADSGLHLSRDGGKTWELVAPIPDGLIDLAASPVDRDRLYAATEQGLLFSIDGGATWQPAHAQRTLATLVQDTTHGIILAYMPGIGLLRMKEPSLRWEFVSNDFSGQALLHIAVDSGDARRMYAITDAQEVIASNNNGVSWVRLEALSDSEGG